MKIECKKSPLHGFGVFATENIEEGELIESCPVITVPFIEWKFVRYSKLVDYMFEWSQDIEKRIAYILGYGMIYNHSFDPNAFTKKDIEEGLFHFYARKNIKIGEEITHNYHGNPNINNPVWFKVNS
jgi:SET domain-containing protein